MLYLIKGDEPVLIAEAVQKILKAENTTAYKLVEITDRKSLASALLALQSPDLFMPDLITIFKITDQHYKTLQKYLPKDNINLITLYPVTLKQFPQWLTQQFERAGFQISAALKDLLCSYVEGNLSAAQQCIEKLKLSYPDGGILTEAQLLEVLIPSARYTVFDLANAIAAQAAHKIPAMLEQLVEAGTEPAIILWALARECRRQKCTAALPPLVEADEIIKGIQIGDVLAALERASLSLAVMKKNTL